MKITEAAKPPKPELLPDGRVAMCSADHEDQPSSVLELVDYARSDLRHRKEIGD